MSFKELPVIENLSRGEKSESAAVSTDPISPSSAAEILPMKKPPWLKIRPPAGENYAFIKKTLRERNLNTVCEEAHCPNVAECWAGGTATFMLGSDTCTRACRFCAVKTARRPPPLDPKEPGHVARSVSDMKLTYVVLTSVDRDDLPDGGASHFALTISEIKRLRSEMIVEALVPDFQGKLEDVRTIVDSGVDVYAHNIETIEKLQRRVRDPRANYDQSMATLISAKEHATASGSKLFTKSSIMVGLGETHDELLQSFRDLRNAGVDILTLGQYLRPTKSHLPVEKYYQPEEFDSLREKALECGFLYVASGPMVRSSYRAGELFIEGAIRKNRARESNEKEQTESTDGIQAT